MNDLLYAAMVHVLQTQQQCMLQQTAALLSCGIFG